MIRIEDAEPGVYEVKSTVTWGPNYRHDFAVKTYSQNGAKVTDLKGS